MIMTDENHARRHPRGIVFTLILLAIATLVIFHSLYLAGEALARAGRGGGSASRSYRSSSSYGSSGSYYGSRSSYGSYSSRNYSSSYSNRYYSRRSYPSSYGGYSSAKGHFLSAVILFITFIVIAVIGVIHYMTAKSTGRSLTGGSPSYGSIFNANRGYGGYGRTAAAFMNGARDADRPDLYELKNRVKEVFMRVQDAWCERDASYAEGYASQRFYYEKSAEIDEMLNRGEKNILKNIRILEVRIIEAYGGNGPVDGDLEPTSAYGGDYLSSGRMKALIRASMIDYVVDEASGRIIKGDEFVPDEFCEQWNFIYNENGWVVDEIVPVD